MFENKTYSTIHSNQLRKYKKLFPLCDKYIYLKLGLINYEEKSHALREGYEVIDARELYNALIHIRKEHFLIEHYIDYIEKEYVSQQNQIFDEMVKNNEIKVINCSDKNKGQAQQFVLSKLHEILATKHGFEYLKFRYSSNNGGSPWVQLSIATRPNAYSNMGESIFWRIDRRDKKLYIRLTQYSNVTETSKSIKYANRDILRLKCSSLQSVKSLKLGGTQNKGLKASEILIFFFKENKISTLLSVLPILSEEVVNLYKTTRWKV